MVVEIVTSAWEKEDKNTGIVAQLYQVSGQGSGVSWSYPQAYVTPGRDVVSLLPHAQQRRGVW